MQERSNIEQKQIYSITMAGYDKLKIITINVNGMNDDVKINVVFSFIRHIGMDIALLQENHSSLNKKA